jgi:hypothetical protein
MWNEKGGPGRKRQERFGYIYIQTYMSMCAGVWRPGWYKNENELKDSVFGEVQNCKSSYPSKCLTYIWTYVICCACTEIWYGTILWDLMSYSFRIAYFNTAIIEFRTIPPRRQRWFDLTPSLESSYRRSLYRLTFTDRNSFQTVNINGH